MKHIGALILKFLIVAVILELILPGLTALTFSRVLIISAVITVLSYIGDLTILPRTTNTASTVVDIGLSLVIMLVFSLIYPLWKLTFLTALLAAVVLGIAEWVFHKFMTRMVLPVEESR